MNKSNIIKVLIFILALGLNVKTIQSIHTEQLAINQDRAKVSKLPMASFHKFWADVKWMLYIQYMGSIDLTTEKNSKDLYEEAKSILELDPGFYKVYEISALMLSAKTPDYAVDLLTMGQDTQQNKDDWRLYQLAGNIRHQETFFNKKANRLEKIQDAIGFYREALKKPGVMPVLEKTYIKIKAQEKFEQDKNINLLVAELQEWDKYINEKSLSPEYGMEAEGDMMLSVDEDTKGNILSIIQRIKREVPEDLTGKGTSQKLLKSIFRDIKVCGNCYIQYKAGEKFCTSCSNPVKVFGICPSAQCGKVHRGGKFCQHCGTVVQKGKPKKKR